MEVEDTQAGQVPRLRAVENMDTEMTEPVFKPLELTDEEAGKKDDGGQR
jgi:hypothetical protein